MKSYSFYISTNYKDPIITNISKQTNDESIIDQESLNSILNKFKYHNLYVVTSIKSDFYKNIWNSPDSDIVLVDSNNISSVLKKDGIKEAYYFVNDEKSFSRDIIQLYSICDFIHLKFRSIFSYDKLELLKQLEIISMFIIQSIKSGIIHNVDHLTGFLFKRKFDGFGNESFFIAPDKQVYYHPDFYYSNSDYGSICKVDNFDEDEESNTHYTKPHLICRTCECFYCDKNVYSNKISTSEYKVPSFEQCNKTTLISRFSKKIFNSIQDNFKLDEYENLDRANSKIIADSEVTKIKNNLVKTNSIKKIRLDYMDE